jgi:hypothetical protein
LNQITKDGQCEDCPNPGEVPNADRLTCKACPSNEIAENGTCKQCPNGENPNSDQTICE